MPHPNSNVKPRGTSYILGRSSIAGGLISIHQTALRLHGDIAPDEVSRVEQAMHS